jgi:hypothetical protein
MAKSDPGEPNALPGKRRRAQRPQGPPVKASDDSQQPNGPSTNSIATPSQQTLASQVANSSDYSEIADIGAGRRWYDRPYRAITALRRSHLGRSLPTSTQNALHTVSNYLFQTHSVQFLEARKSRRWSRIDLPEGEHITLPAVWIVEFYTASEVGDLYKAMKRLGWNGPRFVGTGPRGMDAVSESRAGRGSTWWRIAELKAEGVSGYSGVDRQRARLPKGVVYADLHGVSIGRGITAVVTQFELDGTDSTHLDTILHVDHKAGLIRRPDQMVVAQDPNAVLYFKLQSARAEVHERMRRWVSQTIPGKFSSSGWPHTAFDVVFFDSADPFGTDGQNLRLNDSLRAVGITDYDFQYISSKQLEGLLLEPPQSRSRSSDVHDNVWTFWGNINAYPALTEGTGHPPEARMAAYFTGDRTTDLMARTGLSDLLERMRADASKAHDTARSLHTKGSAKTLKALREQLLTTSLDLATIKEDVKLYNGLRWHDKEPPFTIDSAPWIRQRDQESGFQSDEPRSFSKYHRRKQKRLAEELASFDADYRSVLSTVSSLNSSLESRRIQSIATFISVASLVVAAVTLWATSDLSELSKRLRELANIFL